MALYQVADNQKRFQGLEKGENGEEYFQKFHRIMERKGENLGQGIPYFPKNPYLNLDLAAYHYLNHPDGVKEFYFVLIIDTEKPPWILTRYRYNQNLIKGLTPPGLFKPPVDAGRLLSKGIGWLTWRQLRMILETTKGQFITATERRFVDDLIIYLDYKIKEAERIRNERKQLSFW